MGLAARRSNQQSYTSYPNNSLLVITHFFNVLNKNGINLENIRVILYKAIRDKLQNGIIIRYQNKIMITRFVDKIKS